MLSFKTPSKTQENSKNDVESKFFVKFTVILVLNRYTNGEYVIIANLNGLTCS